MQANDHLRDAAEGKDARGLTVDPQAERQLAITTLRECRSRMADLAAKRPGMENNKSLGLCEYNLGNSEIITMANNVDASDRAESN